MKNTPAIIEVIKDENKEAQDKLRLFLIYFLTVGNIAKEDLSQIERALTAAGCSTFSVNYIKQYFFINYQASNVF